MAFEYPTYIVLDIPAPMADRVMAVRQQHRDTFRMALPVEITVAGSSGVGCIAPHQDPEHVFRVLDSIARTTAPIEAAFGPVFRPPGTDLFVLTLADETPFHNLHAKLIGSGVHFHPSPYGFQPHCTLRSRSPIADEDAAALLAVCLPGQFVLDTISVYMLQELPIRLLHRVQLTG